LILCISMLKWEDVETFGVWLVLLTDDPNGICKRDILNDTQSMLTTRSEHHLSRLGVLGLLCFQQLSEIDSLSRCGHRFYRMKVHEGNAKRRWKYTVMTRHSERLKSSIKLGMVPEGDYQQWCRGCGLFERLPCA
jgi:hypothetical protein